MSALSQEEQIRYHRQLIIPEVGSEGQMKLKKARVIVIGAGGLGSPVLLYLAAAGVGNIGVVDSDTVDLSNLQRQVLYTAEDIGHSKARTAAKKLVAINHSVKAIPFELRLTRENADELISGYDIAVDCCDNYATRYLLSDATESAGIPMIYGAVYQFMGQVSVFGYMNGPSYRDLFPEELHEAIRTPQTPPGVIGVLPGMIGAIEASEVIKLITGAGDLLSGRLLQVDLLTSRFEIISL